MKWTKRGLGLPSSRESDAFWFLNFMNVMLFREASHSSLHCNFLILRRVLLCTDNIRVRFTFITQSSLPLIYLYLRFSVCLRAANILNFSTTAQYIVEHPSFMAVTEWQYWILLLQYPSLTRGQLSERLILCHFTLHQHSPPTHVILQTLPDMVNHQIDG